MNMIYLQCKTKIIPTDKEVSGKRKQKGMILWQEKIIEEEIKVLKEVLYVWSVYTVKPKQRDKISVKVLYRGEEK